MKDSLLPEEVLSGFLQEKKKNSRVHILSRKSLKYIRYLTSSKFKNDTKECQKLFDLKSYSIDDYSAHMHETH